MEDGFRVGAGNAVDGIEIEVEIGTSEETGDAREIEYAMEEMEVVFRRGNDLYREGRRFHREGEGVAAIVNGDLGEIRHPQLRENLRVSANRKRYERLLVDGIRDGLGGCSAVRSVEPTNQTTSPRLLHAEIRIQTAGIVAGGEDKTSVGDSVLTRATCHRWKLSLPNDTRHGWGGHDASESNRPSKSYHVPLPTHVPRRFQRPT